MGQRFAEEASLVFFDLETGGFRYVDHDILQIAAVCGPKAFNVYVKPERKIPPGASQAS